MNILLIGINHKTASVKVREKFSFTKKHLTESLTQLKKSGLAHGAVILSTCNRTEIYIHQREHHVDINTIKSFIFKIFGAKKNEITRYFYILKGALAIKHLFRVTAGLDSQVLGETQILTQVESAWARAKEVVATDGAIDQVFEQALTVGKMVRLETKISQGNISIGSIAIKMLESKCRNLKKKSVLIIGTGKIGTLMSKYLKDKAIKSIFVTSRTYSRALELAAICQGKAVDFTRLKEELRNVGIVISSTSCPHIILKKEDVAEIMKIRKKALYVIDLGLPRNVDPDIKHIKGVSLWDLDGLKAVAQTNHKKREKEAVYAEKIIDRELKCFITNCS